MNPHIKILILNWNGEHLLKPCLESVYNIDYSNYSVLVIDNGSNDESITMINNNFPEVELLKLKINYGYAGGYNKSFNFLKNNYSGFILLLNNDTEVDPDILKNFIYASERYGKNNIFGGKIFYHNDKSKLWYAGGNIKLQYMRISHIGIRKYDSEEYNKPLKTDYVTGCCLFTSIETINLLNGFDEKFDMYGEDVDFCLRASKKNIYCYYWPHAKLWHHISASIGGAYSIIKIYKKMVSLYRLLIKQIKNKNNYYEKL